MVARVAKEVVNVVTADAPPNSWADIVSKEKRGGFINNLAREVAKETRVSSLDRSKRENNCVIFGCCESEGEVDEKKRDNEFVESLCKYIGLESGNVEVFRLGKKKEKIIRPIKLIFENLDNKKQFLSLLYKLKNGPEDFKKINIQHDLSPSERDYLKTLLKEAKEKNEKEQPKGFLYKVRGPPFDLKIVKVEAKN